ncbi:phosphate ABC transporter permease subunit PstC [Methermicoccus shengliensis]|uniref:Phosphate transport system permease protein n=1 Tax=Methermicoccus shengliensis TaxID=660064 RepID=A0A832VX44_9EURY|nr:phosphate ABC transporter permease subunit PstC [Methermicoccus shengliensis]KUK05069.1 MAG: Phosphate ABC transporter, inner membrane subunit PstC [Euryarchaeota archaeon 55_53]KUK30362.1 MAG: Phosphate ABC transporter, inner membrane subunit PstC [Methanosarcinales archeaon 56_1174]MDI3487547.1 phosphate transport system permease protein [Methanosarcinales archaeon]MDN5294696.1 phosphate transport system permease protein [Methanosarcinales archaeon]HIH69408.1 phosphate ABC transporter per
MKDKFKISFLPFSALVFGIFALMLIVYFTVSMPIFQKEGIHIYTTNQWEATEGKEFYGVLAAIYGSIYTSILAVLIALPLSISFAVFVIDYVPKNIKEPLIVATDVMAGLPTIIYGIWGAFVLVPFLRDFVMKPLYRYLSFVPFFSTEPITGYSFLSAGVLLGIMITPFASAIIREAYRMIPFTYREAVYGVGATRYEATKVLIGCIKPAVIAGTLLGFGRAIGETVAVTLVVGNTFNISPSLFSPGYTVSSLIANQFGNAFIYEYMPSALFAAGLSLFFIGLAVNVLGILVLKRWYENAHQAA